MAKVGSIESLGFGDHVDALGLAGDLAVAEKSPAKIASAVRKKSLTDGTHCQRLSLSLLFFYSKILIFGFLAKIISPVSEIQKL